MIGIGRSVGTLAIWLALTAQVNMPGPGRGGEALQRADPAFNASVARPTYTRNRPRLVIDEAHRNFHTASGRYKPFADLATNDGYLVTANKQLFTAAALAGADVLVIANAAAQQGGAAGFGAPAFDTAEVRAVTDWVRAGGSLLLIADHAPFGAAAEPLAQAFGVEMSKGLTSDPVERDPDGSNASILLFSRDNGLLGPHPITDGRQPSERVGRVLTFTGQSLKGPQGSAAFLRLGNRAIDRASPSPADIQAAIARARESAKQQGLQGPQQVQLSAGAGTSAAGRAQGLAMQFGAGRVVVLGEAAMLTAQLDPQGRPFGMNRAGIDNRQLALNILHWLSEPFESRPAKRPQGERQ